MLCTVPCDDQLAALVERNPFLLTVCGEEPIASPRKLGLETVGRVIESRVQDATISSACMESAIELPSQ